MAPLSRPKQPISHTAHISDRVPFEIWRDVFQLVFSIKTEISHPPSKWEWSALNSRLNVYRALALVSRVWRDNARGVFFENLQAESAESVKGIARCIQDDRELAKAVMKISFSFYEYRCAMSTPRRPRALRSVELGEQETAAAIRTRVKISTYRPSVTMQATHWRSWHSYISYILHTCTSLSDVTISFTADHTARGQRRSGHHYATLFPVPDLRNSGVLQGLLALQNLRKLILIDPSPLAEYGPAMAAWERLHAITIILTRSYPELSATSFIPPRNLASFTFHDRTDGSVAWPLASDLARCTNLYQLNLGITSLRNPVTVEAIAFLIRAYQGTLEELTIDLLEHYYSRHGDGLDLSILFAKTPKVHFTRLRTLRFPHGRDQMSILSNIRCDALTHLHFGDLNLGLDQVGDEYWRKILCQSNLKGLKKLEIETVAERVAEALRTLCLEMDIELVIHKTH